MNVSTDVWLACLHCGTEHAFGSVLACSRCGSGLLDVRYARVDTTPIDEHGIWRYAGALPPMPDRSRVSLGEGGTPTARLELEGVLLECKLEAANPTGSFKARFNAVNISVARLLGARAIKLSSTGNAGLAAAAYAAAAGLDASVKLPRDSPAAIVASIRALGAQTAWIDEAQGDDPGFPASRGMETGMVTPYGAEGYKTIAYELASSRGGRPLLDVFVPAGGGDGLHGIGKGFGELQHAGLIERVPRLHAARTTASVARSISGDALGQHGRDAVTTSGGSIVEVPEAVLAETMRMLLHRGAPADPASVAAIAAARMRADRLEDDSTVCVVTGDFVRWSPFVEDWLRERGDTAPAA